MRRKMQRIFSAVSLVIVSGILGGTIADLLARSAIVSMTSARLETYAWNFLEEDKRITADVNATLDTADASTAIPCSDEDFALLRKLQFRSPYIKDVGRKEDHLFLCSVMAGKLANPFRSPLAPYRQVGQHNFLYNVPIKIDPNFHGEIVSSLRSNVIVAPDVFDAFHQLPMFFSAAVVDPLKHTMVTTYSNAPIPAPQDLMLNHGFVQRNGYLLFSNCIDSQQDCVVTGIPIATIWTSNRRTLAEAIAGGALLGLLFSATVIVMDLNRRTLPNQLRRAIRRKHLTVVYQPIVEVRNGNTVGAEALVRWTDEEGYPISPETFIELAETHGFVGTITTFVLQCVLEDLGEFLRAHPAFHVSINMSAQDLTDTTFIERLDKLLLQYRVSPSSIGMELTERSTAEREHVIQTIHQLRSRGHLVYIDDFGTGYSSLSYLNELAVDVLKVDRSFTQTIGTDSITSSILPQILSMARALKLKIIVEGVERAEQAAYLAQADGPIYAQGWHYGAPVNSHLLKSRLHAL